jgi:hypothetical protein
MSAEPAGVRGRVARGWPAAAWLLADASVAALVAWPAETLLLYVLSPEIPLTLGGFLATMLAVLPQVVVVFVLAGPLLVLLGMALAVGRTTRQGLSARYVLRFSLLDTSLLALAAGWQWISLGALLPETARLCLALITSSLVAAALLFALLVLLDNRRPGLASPPWIAAVTVGLVVALTASGLVRRLDVDDLRALDAPGFQPSRPLVIVEVPGLDPDDLVGYMERGQAVSLERLAARGSMVRVHGGPLADPLALHATFVTGRRPRHHGVLASVRYRPAAGRRSFGVLPRGLFLRPLLSTPLWERIPVDHEVARAAGLPLILGGLGVPAAKIGDPLGWPRGTPADLIVPSRSLEAGARVLVGREEVSCSSAGQVHDRFFDPPAERLDVTQSVARLIAASLEEDLCALEVARSAVDERRWPVVHLRLRGHDRVAYQVAGWRAASPARGVSEREIQAFGRTLTRYVRELDPALGRLLDAVPPRSLVAIVSPQGIKARTDVERLAAELLGRTTATGTHAGPSDGVLLLAGEGVRPGAPEGFAMPLRSVLPTLLWAVGLPAAEDMGAVAFARFEEDFVRENPVVAVGTYTRTAP